MAREFLHAGDMHSKVRGETGDGHVLLEESSMEADSIFNRPRRVQAQADRSILLVPLLSRVIWPGSSVAVRDVFQEEPRQPLSD